MASSKAGGIGGASRNRKDSGKKKGGVINQTERRQELQNGREATPSGRM